MKEPEAHCLRLGGLWLVLLRYGDLVPFDEVFKFRSGQGSPRLIQIQVFPQIVPAQAKLRVVLPMEDLQHFSGFTFVHCASPFVGCPMHVRYLPDQGHPFAPIALQDDLGLFRVFEHWQELAHHAVNVLDFHILTI